MHEQSDEQRVGVIRHIEDCGSIVMVCVVTEHGWLEPVFFDHRSFGHLLEGERCDANALVGRKVRVADDNLRFLVK